ncbi:MAG: efflux RND transporter permease subunit, partial [bacterium]|nr:efflux RND transporter permease subunit [bacterium]
IWVEFEWGEDIHRARQTVNERLNLAADSLPPGVQRPILAPISSIMGEILFIALTSEVHSPLELRTVADTTIRRRLLAVSGVAQVTPIGGAQKQYQVVLHPAKLKVFGVTVSQVEEALGRANQNTSAGFRVAGGQEYLIQGFGRLQDTEEIGQAVVASRNSTPILIRDLGEVRIGEALKRGEGAHNSETAVIVGIKKQPDTNTLALTRELEALLADMRKDLP